MSEQHDPIVAGVRAAGDAFFRRFDYNLTAAMDALRRRSAEHGRQVVAMSPKPPMTTPAAPSQAIG